MVDQGEGKIINRPQVITLNNVAATIQSLTIMCVNLPSTGTVINTGTGGVAGSASTATEKIFFFQAEDGIRDLYVTGSSDVCSSDLGRLPADSGRRGAPRRQTGSDHRSDRQ